MSNDEINSEMIVEMSFEETPENLSYEELEFLLEDLNQSLAELEEQEPPEEDCEAYDYWLDAVADLEDRICEVEEALAQCAPPKSVVQVHFPGRNMTLAYFNDRFDLHPGDLVYVDGKLAGKRGRVVDVCYNFKIKRSEYKQVIGVVDTTVHGEFFIVGSHFISFDPDALPAKKARGWFNVMPIDESDYVVGYDGTSFPLERLENMKVAAVIAERGRAYYTENKVRYMAVSGHKGYAIVEGSEPYEVEFAYRDGEISKLTCSCLCSYHCKHEVAAMLQLKEMLELIGKRYAEQYEETKYFAAVTKAAFFEYAINGKETGTIVL